MRCGVVFLHICVFAGSHCRVAVWGARSPGALRLGNRSAHVACRLLRCVAGTDSVATWWTSGERPPHIQQTLWSCETALRPSVDLLSPTELASKSLPKQPRSASHASTRLRHRLKLPEGRRRDVLTWRVHWCAVGAQRDRGRRSLCGAAWSGRLAPTDVSLPRPAHHLLQHCYIVERKSISQHTRDTRSGTWLALIPRDTSPPVGSDRAESCRRRPKFGGRTWRALAPSRPASCNA